MLVELITTTFLASCVGATSKGTMHFFPEGTSHSWCVPSGHQLETEVYVLFADGSRKLIGTKPAGDNIIKVNASTGVFYKIELAGQVEESNEVAYNYIGKCVGGPDFIRFRNAWRNDFVGKKEFRAFKRAFRKC